MKVWEHIRSLGFGGLSCGGLAGLLFVLYPDAFPPGSTHDGVVLAGALLGAACGRVARVLVVKPFLYYTCLVQLKLLRRHIGARTQTEIIRELTLRYFLGRGAEARRLPGRGRPRHPEGEG